LIFPKPRTISSCYVRPGRQRGLGANMNLFVYGTLLSCTGHPMGARLAREARLLGPATIKGRLFDLGRYPALIEAGPRDGLVHGEVYVLRSPPATLRWLDAYEGVTNPPKANCEYERVLRPVHLSAGGEVKAAVYLYRRDISRARYLENGRWRSSNLIEDRHSESA
jgi:gamma-glutamylcyclotransferase (GGCT)/AIG2-like uncharacterized protein YtfP